MLPNQIRTSPLFQTHCIKPWALFIPLLLATPGAASAQSALDDGLIFASDFMIPSKVRVFDPAAGTLVYDYTLADDARDICGGGAYCFNTGMLVHHRGTEDFIDLAISVVDPKASSAADVSYSVVRRIKPGSTTQTIFDLKDLDFSDIPNPGAYCTQAPGNTCGTPTDPRCRMDFMEGIRLVEEDVDAKTITYIMADGNGGRVIQATLDYNNDNTCAHVDWVLGPNHPDWPAPTGGWTWPNGVDYFERGDEGTFLLVDFFVSDPNSGGSQMHLYKWDEDDWALAWAFPDTLPGDRGFLNTPHMSEILMDPTTGKETIWYSHSRGSASDWHADSNGYGATWGVLEMGNTLDEAPTYQWELGLWNNSGKSLVGFTRDQDYLADGTLLLTDAGCQNACKNSSVLYHVDPSFTSDEPSGLAGYYSTDFNAQEFIQIPDDAILGEYRCGLGALFETEFVPSSQLGSELTRMKNRARRNCPNK